MSVSPRYAVAVWGRNAAMYRRTWKWNLLPNFFEPVFYLTAVGIGVGAYIEEMGGMSYLEFLAPGLVCVAAMNGASYETTYNVFVRLVHDKAYDVMLTTPIEPEDVLAGEVMWAMTRATVYGGCFFVIVAVAGLAPMPSSLLALPAMLLTALLFASMGMAFSLFIETIDFFSFYFTLFLTPLFLFSGVFFPLNERLSPTWQRVAELLPLLHPVRLARMAFRGQPDWGLIAWDVGYILVFSALLLALGSLQIRKRLTS